MEGLLGLPPAALVWVTQHVLNTVHPSAVDRSHVSGLLRVAFLLFLHVMTRLVAMGLLLERRCPRQAGSNGGPFRRRG